MNFWGILNYLSYLSIPNNLSNLNYLSIPNNLSILSILSPLTTNNQN